MKYYDSSDDYTFLVLIYTMRYITVELFNEICLFEAIPFNVGQKHNG